jgi:hypothetical protein
MADSIRDQMLDRGLITEAETPEGVRAAARAAEPAEPEKQLPPPFEAPARGVIVTSTHRPVTTRQCVECGAPLPPSLRAVLRRCAECAADGA